VSRIWWRWRDRAGQNEGDTLYMRKTLFSATFLSRDWLQVMLQEPRANPLAGTLEGWLGEV